MKKMALLSQTKMNIGKPIDIGTDDDDDDDSDVNPEPDDRVPPRPEPIIPILRVLPPQK